MSITSGSLGSELSAWLEQNSSCLDTDNTRPAEVLPRRAAGGVLGAGVSKEHGGSGGDVTDSIRAIADISKHSLAAGFVLWGHRAYIELLLQSPNPALREMLLPDLIAGRVAGATGLSNAMKILAGLEELQVNARPRADGFALTGKLPWVTNLRPQGFQVAAAVAHEGGNGVFIASLAHDDPGLVRSADLDLMALRASNTAAVSIADVQIYADRVIHPDASISLPAGRPAFLGLQCGMSIGLAQRALHEARSSLVAGRNTLAEPVAELSRALAILERDLLEGLRGDTLRTRPEVLFQIRIALADVVMRSVGLELQSVGGKAYLAGPGAGFGRRWREAAFIPVVTPSLVQLKAALAARRPDAA